MQVVVARCLHPFESRRLSGDPLMQSVSQSDVAAGNVDQARPIRSSARYSGKDDGLNVSKS